MNLPVASTCEQDKDNDWTDRLILNLTASGRLIYRSEEVTLADLAKELAAEARAYHRERRDIGESGYVELRDGRWSRLFVLLRADQDAPWRHVRWVMAELSQSKIYKLQFAGRIAAGRNRTQAENEKLWAAREIYFHLSTLAGKLPCFLPTAAEPEASYLDVRLVGSPARYVFGARTTLDSTVLSEWLGEARRERGEQLTHGRISAGPRTPFGDVIAAVNSLKIARIGVVEFAGIERAPEDVRQARRLPR